MTAEDQRGRSVHVHHAQVGSGPAIVLSHGLGDDASTWSTLVPLLADRCTVVTWDLRGHGRGAAPETADAYSADLALADLLGLVGDLDQPVHLVGHSLGGYLSLAASLREPDQVASLTLIASGPGFRDREAREAWNRAVDRAVVAMPVPRVAAGLAHQHSSWVIDQLRELRPPLLVIVGEQDTRFHAGSSYIARVVAGSTVVQIPDANHFPHRSHPDAVAAAIRRHVRSAAVSGRRSSPGSPTP